MSSTNRGGMNRISMAAVRAHYEAGDGERHWFDPGTRRWWRSRIAAYGYIAGFAARGRRVYFVSSERDTAARGAWNGQRRYTVRVYDCVTRKLETVEPFGAYPTRGIADRAARRAAAQEVTP